MIKVRQGGVVKDVVVVQVRQASGAGGLKTLQTGFVRTTAGLKAFFSAFSASANPASVSGFGSSNYSIPVVTGDTTVSPSGGISPYTYSWAPNVGWTVLNPASSNTSFRANSLSPGSSVSTTFNCTVTDAIGHSVTVSVEATAENYGS